MRHIAALVVAVAVQSGELRLDPSLPPVQIEQDIRTLIGSEAETRAIIHQAIESFFIVSLMPADSPRTANVLAAQLPFAWLPHVAGVTFVRLDAQRAARAWGSGCLPLMWIEVTLVGGVLAVAVTEGDRCQRRRSVVEFMRTERGWQRGWGIRPTVEKPPANCPCK